MIFTQDQEMGLWLAYGEDRMQRALLSMIRGKLDPRYLAEMPSVGCVFKNRNRDFFSWPAGRGGTLPRYKVQA